MEIFKSLKNKLIVSTLISTIAFTPVVSFAQSNEMPPAEILNTISVDDKGEIINIDKLRASGLIVGPVFGNSSYSYGGADLGKIKKYGGLSSALAWCLSSKIPDKKVGIVANQIAAAINLVTQVIPDDYTYIYGTVNKNYQEVHYSDGSFAYYITNYTVSSYLHDKEHGNMYITTVKESYEGPSPMSLNNEL